MKKMVKFSFAAMMLSATFFGTTTAAPVTADAKARIIIVPHLTKHILMVFESQQVRKIK